jgi:hypothetical protein
MSSIKRELGFKTYSR